ncbi:hypothetical protein EST38_g1160 [Candolleomyces aberdarensis]|uniref:Uncharacterized protein n=1 Tax=Candolleomyces aberdarensis TaxID=2316362 RepID=A0A4Q2DWU1_9AGAR|nr:hypothetical protein EST38_g1160 [Candolleomyces aberdarensis]
MLSSPPHPPRPSHTSPISFERPSSQATILPPSSPPSAKRPSLSTTMHWLSRSPNQNSTQSNPSPYAAPKPVRISEPKFVRGMDSLTQQRSGVLGAGATVVRTPDDALREIPSRPSLESRSSDDRPHRSASSKSKKRKPSISRSMTAPSLESVGLNSPPLPPLPFPESDEEVMLSRSSSGSSKPRTPRLLAAVPASVPVPVPVPRSPSLRPSLKIKSVPSSDERDVVPPLPSSVPPSPPPVFKPILVSDLPAFPVDPETVIVTLETCTTTHRTTLETINSRPSHLSKYVNSLIARQRATSATSSLYSDDEESDDLAVYRKHLASQGLLPQTSCKIHLFLDRPSAPYAHILSYLRSNPGTPENPEVIPRAVLYNSPSQASRLESLIELRDEAAYLNLENLHKMCSDEMVRMRHAPPPKMHARGNSLSGSSGPTSMVQSLRASVYTLHTLLERAETDGVQGEGQCDVGSGSFAFTSDSTVMGGSWT